MVDVDPERFDLMVSEALDGIPAEALGELMSNVAITVQHDGGPPGLLGLYQGVPLTRRSTFYAGALPDRITIYRRAICAVCTSDSEVVERVRRTVIHEVGHHFGIGDARLRELRMVMQQAKCQIGDQPTQNRVTIVPTRPAALPHPMASAVDESLPSCNS